MQWISPLRGSTSSVRMLTASRFLSPLVCGTYISAGWRRPARDVGSNWPSCGCIGVPRGTPWTTLHIHGEPLPRWPRRGRVHARCFLGELLVACFCCHWRSISVSAGGNENVINGVIFAYREAFSRCTQTYSFGFGHGSECLKYESSTTRVLSLQEGCRLL